MESRAKSESKITGIDSWTKSVYVECVCYEEKVNDRIYGIIPFICKFLVSCSFFGLKSPLNKKACSFFLCVIVYILL